MKRFGGVGLIVAVVGLSLFWSVRPASAHNDGCHRYHSCPADDGSYQCGDLGYACETQVAGTPGALPATPAALPAAVTSAPAQSPAAPAAATPEEQRANLPRTGIRLEYLLAAIEISLFLAGVVLIIGDPWLRRRPT